MHVVNKNVVPFLAVGVYSSLSRDFFLLIKLF